VWWKIAASLLLICLTGYLYWNKTVSTKVPSYTQVKEVRPEAKKADKTENVLRAEPLDEKMAKDGKTSSPNVAQPKKLSDKTIQPKKLTADVGNGAPAVSDEKIALDESFSVADNTVQNKVSNVSPQKQSSITLTYGVEETNKYLDKSGLAEATSTGKKSSTFKRLLKKASDLKSNQDPFGDLRERKNEILALNFKGEKRGQNK
jgi:hypothetical protein